MDNFNEILSPLILLLLMIGFLTIGIYAPRLLPRVDRLIDTIKALRKRSKVKKIKEITDYDSLYEVLDAAGYAYDIRQDYFFTTHDAWQREMGYCRLYDEAAAPMSMIIDCEPIYFEYDNKRWLIEFWKGQYGMTTGFEIGVYSTDLPDIISDIFFGTFYECVGDNDMLKMSFDLKKNGKTLIKKRERHWWLTGFKLGEFSEPNELTANINITLKNKIMRDQFIKGLNEAGYREEEIIVIGNSVGLKFDKPRTRQPYTRTELTDKITQGKNKLLCDRYMYITRDYDNILDKIIAIQKLDPYMIKDLFLVGNSKPFYSEYLQLKKFLK